MHSAGDLVVWVVDFNGHVGWHIDGFDGLKWRVTVRMGEN